MAHAVSRRDVFLVVRPDRTALALFLALREGAEGATQVLVPTARPLGADLPARHPAGSATVTRCVCALAS